ncbi:AraC family transcriptional activator FtrA [Isoptericola jiangsuensis]|uniref:AraC family transcriptional activator FtrA n=1 Tax=Isoptericola jiangsuensis TaxID=548579 RepID=A0A2A9EUQ5_9MICO|nr:helix-turn-helix domain-containing protein [Isoptericola jiangsuensis]PFG41965.1 AraC family transcriptional activator FtrA [Isoptericola jiangsuensis]
MRQPDPAPRPLPAPGRPHRVAVLVTPGMAPFETGAVVEVFGLPRPEVSGPWYALDVCTPDPDRPVAMVGGLSVTVAHGLDVLTRADTVIVPATVDVRTGPEPRVVDAVRRAAERGARVVSICSGAFTLAAAGLLDGRRATTHWRYADEFRRRFPAVELDPDVLWVDHGDVLTSAGSAAGIDLCLHLVRSDHGSVVANTVARRLVVPPHRDGGQAQFVDAPVPDAAGTDGVSLAMAAVLRDVAAPVTVAAMARTALMSERTFLRRFTERTGTSPVRWVVGQRVQASLPLLEGTDLPVEEVGAAVGFASPATFRHHFGQVLRTSPSAYRRTFRRDETAGAA